MFLFLTAILFGVCKAGTVIQECNKEAAGFTKVREVKAAYAKWHPATDNLAGTDVYGTLGTSDAASIAFSHMTFD